MLFKQISFSKEDWTSAKSLSELLRFLHKQITKRQGSSSNASAEEISSERRKFGFIVDFMRDKNRENQ